MAWKLKSSKEVYKNKWMRVTEDKVVTEFGNELTWGVIRKEPFVLVIPWDGKAFTLVGQYRYPVDFYSWEFPCGHTEGKDVEESAKEELKEETGLVAEKIELLANYHLAPGYQTQVGYVFLARGLRFVKVNREGAEKGMKVRKVTIDEFENMIQNGEIKDGVTLAAYTLLRTSKNWRS